MSNPISPARTIPALKNCQEGCIHQLKAGGFSPLTYKEEVKRFFPTDKSVGFHTWNFMKTDYSIKEIPKQQTYEWFLYKHYAHRIPSISFSYGLFKNNELVGVCTYGTPASSTLLNGICGKEYSQSVKELNRLVLDDNRKNLASFFIAKTFKLLPTPLIIVSYADTSQNHIGYVYQALNFIYTGLSSKFLDPKVKGLERQHHATYAHGMNNKQLKDKFGDKLYFKERARKHRYIIFIGNKTEKKQMFKNLKYKIFPYPKGDNKNYDASYKPTIQKTLF